MHSLTYAYNSIKTSNTLPSRYPKKVLNLVPLLAKSFSFLKTPPVPLYALQASIYHIPFTPLIMLFLPSYLFSYLISYPSSSSSPQTPQPLHAIICLPTAAAALPLTIELPPTSSIYSNATSCPREPKRNKDRKIPDFEGAALATNAAPEVLAIFIRLVNISSF